MAIQFNSFKKNSNNHAMLLAAHMNCLVKKIKKNCSIFKNCVSYICPNKRNKNNLKKKSYFKLTFFLTKITTIWSDYTRSTSRQLWRGQQPYWNKVQYVFLFTNRITKLLDRMSYCSQAGSNRPILLTPFPHLKHNHGVSVRSKGDSFSFVQMT